MRTLLILVLLLAFPCEGQQRHHISLRKLAEHAALGASIDLGMGQLAGPGRRLQIGLPAAALVAGFKEGSDAIAGRDTPKQAAWHAFSQMIGAAIAAGARR